MIAGLAALLLVGPPEVYNLRFRPAGTESIVLQAVEDRVEGKTRTTLGTRFELVPGAGLVADLKTGPFTSMGRTFGRPKSRHLRLTPRATLAGDALDRPPFLLSVPLPGHPVKQGESWRGVLVGPTPMPAGVGVTFRALGEAKAGGVPCLRVVAKIDTELGGAHITGSGDWSLRLEDGLVQWGSLKSLLVYRRPNPTTRKMEESARVSVKATIARA